MSRHRDVRNMDYSDDYDGYDDIYGHSVDDDYYISPSNRQFIYNRDISQRSSEGDIKEEDESEAELSDVDRDKLATCINQITKTLESINISRNDLVNIIIKSKFDVEKSINTILEDPQYQTGALEKDDNQLNKLNLTQSTVDLELNQAKSTFIIPNIFNKIPDTAQSKPTNSGSKVKKDSKSTFFVPKLTDSGDKPKFTIPNFSMSGKPKFTILNLSKNEETTLDKTNIGTQDIRFNSLSDLVSTHLKNNSIDTPTIEIENKMQNLTINNKSSITNNLNKISLSMPSHVVPSNDLTEMKIDLTKALKSTVSTPLIEQKVSENFEIPFVSCVDEDTSTPDRETLTCNFNISEIKTKHFNLEKRRTCFGKIICRKYKKHVKLFLPKFTLTNIKRFDFSTLSPDSRISGYLKS